MTDSSTAKAAKYRWITIGGERFYDVGLLPDGSLHNPNGYPEDDLRAAIETAQRREHEQRSEAAKRAAETRRKRKDRKLYEVIERYLEEGHLQPASHCVLCGKGLGDPESLDRGIGSECWQRFLRAQDFYLAALMATETYDDCVDEFLARLPELDVATSLATD
jgi:hypothetical protein